MPKKIESWQELAGLESEKYKVQVRLFGYGGCAFILPKVETEETTKEYSKHHFYLSTHTFYPSTCKASTEILQKCGFDVELVAYE